MTAKCHLLSNRYFHCHKKLVCHRLFSLLIKTIFSNESSLFIWRAHAWRRFWLAGVIFQWTKTTTLSEKLFLIWFLCVFRSVEYWEIFLFSDFEFGNKLRKKRPDRWIFWNSAGIDRIETNRIVMQDSGQANQNAEQAKPRTTNQLDYIKKVVFKSVAKHKHAWPFQVKRILKKIKDHKSSQITFIV